MPPLVGDIQDLGQRCKKLHNLSFYSAGNSVDERKGKKWKVMAEIH